MYLCQTLVDENRGITEPGNLIHPGMLQGWIQG